VFVSVTGLIMAQDLATAACGVFNAAYFGRYAWMRRARARRLAAIAMALVSLAALVEAGFSQGLLWSQTGGPLEGVVSFEGWALLRLPLLAATAFVSLLVWRRLQG
jgi:hypothetical protein